MDHVLLNQILLVSDHLVIEDSYKTKLAIEYIKHGLKSIALQDSYVQIVNPREPTCKLLPLGKFDNMLAYV